MTKSYIKPKKRVNKVISVTKAKRKAWIAFSKFVRLRDCLKTTGTVDFGRCYTCGNEYPFKNLQAGHFIPGRRNQYLLNEVQVHSQCYRCNVGLHGNWPVYLEMMNNNYGKKAVEQMLIEAKNDKIMKWFDWEEEEKKFNILYKNTYEQRKKTP